MKTPYQWVEYMYTKHRNLFLKKAYRLCRDYELAEEIVQDAFYKFLSQLYRRPDLIIESERHIRAMLSNQVVWSVSEYGEKKDKARKAKIAFRNYVDCFNSNTEERLDTWPLGGILIKNIDKLPNVVQRIILEEQIVNGLSNKEIAEKYNLIEDSIGTRKILGFKRIRNNHFGNNRLKSSFPSERNWDVSAASLANLFRPDFSKETLRIVELKQTMSFKEIATEMNMLKSQVKNRYYHYKKSNKEE